MALAAARGWSVAGEYVDNDTSASKLRGTGTAWGRMLRDAEARRFDVVVAVDMDRLLRTIGDLSTLVATNVRVVTVDGEIDLTTADGEFRATMLAGIARFEVRRKSERQRRANAQRRASGVPTGGRAPYGYSYVPTKDRVKTGSRAAYVARAGEAEAVAAAYDHIQRGGTMGRLVKEWNDAGRRTPPIKRNPTGSPWTATSLRRVLLSPFYAGLIPDPEAARSGHYRSERIEPAHCMPGAWEPLVDRSTWDDVRSILLDPHRKTSPGTARRWLLSGLARCSVCDAPVTSGARGPGRPTYRCPANHFSRLAEPLDAAVESLVLERLSRPDAADLLRPPSTDHEAEREARRVERATLERRRRSIVDLIADGSLDAVEARDQLTDLRRRVDDLDQSLRDAPRVGPLVDMIDGDAAAVWQALPLDLRRVVVGALLTLRLSPLGKGRGGTRFPFTEHAAVEWNV